MTIWYSFYEREYNRNTLNTHTLTVNKHPLADSVLCSTSARTHTNHWAFDSLLLWRCIGTGS